MVARRDAFITAALVTVAALAVLVVAALSYDLHRALGPLDPLAHLVAYAGFAVAATVFALRIRGRHAADRALVAAFPAGAWLLALDALGGLGYGRILVPPNAPFLLVVLGLAGSIAATRRLDAA